MPFNDPHTAGPSLWAWRDAEGHQFECSAAPVDLDTRDRLGLEAWLLWQHRLEHGSTLCNFGRFHPHYSKSRDRKTQRRGGRLGHGAVNPAGGPTSTPLRLLGQPVSTDWMGLTWSTWAPHDASGTGNWRIALPEVPCVSKMTIAYLASFLRVSPFRKTHDFMVHVKLDVLYRDAIEKLGEVNDKDCMKYVARKMLA
jgi:hypothetical protein